MSKKLAGTALLLGGLAAYAVYKISQMSEEDKTRITDDLLEKGKNLISSLLPGNKSNSWENQNSLENTVV